MSDLRVETANFCNQRIKRRYLKLNVFTAHTIDSLAQKPNQQQT